MLIDHSCPVGLRPRRRAANGGPESLRYCVETSRCSRYGESTLQEPDFQGKNGRRT